MLSYLFQFFDYTLDVVCYACVNIFNNLLKIHANRCINCINKKLECEWIIYINKLLTDSKTLNAFQLRALVLI